MTAHWEVYSVAERKVVIATDILGGANAPSKGITGDPGILVGDAFRDNVRRLLASDAFRRVVSPPAAAPIVAASPSPATLATLTLLAARPKPGAQFPASVAGVSPDGSGRLPGSDDGYLITTTRGGRAKVVRLKWSDGARASAGAAQRPRPRRGPDQDLAGPSAAGHRHTAAQQGETVFAIGSPLGAQFQNTMSKGIVSALRDQQGLAYIQSDVMVNHGSSGGPLLDETGAVIGLTASGQTINGAPVGINFFIPIDDALKTLNVNAAPTAPVHEADRKP